MVYFYIYKMKTWHQFVRAGLGEITQKRCLTRASELSEIMAEEWRVKSKLAYKITPGRSAPPRLLWNRHVQESAHRVDDLWESCLGTGPAGVEPSHQVWSTSSGSALLLHCPCCSDCPCAPLCPRPWTPGKDLPPSSPHLNYASSFRLPETTVLCMTTY